MTGEETRQFSSACASPSPFLLGVEQAGIPGISWRAFDQPYIVAGRDPRMDLHLDDSQVSRRHAYFQIVAGRLFVVDLHSRTGTRWSDERGLWGWVRKDLGVTIGPFRLRLRDDDLPSSRSDDLIDSALPISRAFEQPALPTAALEVWNDPTGSKVWQVNRSLVLIGSSSACKIQLKSPAVSPIHASLLRTPHGFFLVDLFGRGGTRVNGQLVRHARIDVNDEVAVGSTRIRVLAGKTGQKPKLVRHTGDTQSPIALPPALLDAGIHDDSSDNLADLIRSLLETQIQIQLTSASQLQETIVAAIQGLDKLYNERIARVLDELHQVKQRAEYLEQRAKAAAAPRHPSLGFADSIPLGTEERATLPSDSFWPRATADLQPSIDHDRPMLPELAPDPKVAANFADQISSRIAQLDQEHQHRWQKLWDICNNLGIRL